MNDQLATRTLNHLDLAQSGTIVEDPLTVVTTVIGAQDGDRGMAFRRTVRTLPAAIVALAMQRVSECLTEAEKLAQETLSIQRCKNCHSESRSVRRMACGKIVHRMAINRITRGRLSVSCGPLKFSSDPQMNTSPQPAAE